MTWKRTTIAAVVAALGVDAAFAEKHEEVPAATLLVRVYDEVGLGASEFEQFRNVAARLLKTAGIASIWVHCRAADGASNPAGCREFLRGHELVVRLSPRAPRGSSLAMGVSLSTATGTGAYATLYHSSVKGLAEGYRASYIDILALAAVHEIGHLLGGPAHYPWGIMQTNWTDRQVSEFLRGGMLFSQPHARRLRANLARRSGQILAAK